MRSRGGGPRWGSAWRGLGPVDVVPVLVVLAVSQQEVWAPFPGFPHPESHRGLHALAYAATALALLWRRQQPVRVLAAIATIATVEYVLLGAPEGLGTYLPPLLALYAVGRYAEPREILVAGPLAVLAIAVHELRDPDFRLDGPAVIFWLLLAAAWLTGARLRRQVVITSTALARQDESVRDARTAERARIARDLHDVVGHAVGVVLLQSVAGTAQLDKGRHDELRDRFTAIETTAREALTEMRRLVDLGEQDDDALDDPARPDAGSVTALVERLRQTGLDVRLEVRGRPDDGLPAAIGRTAYRLVQEALTNTMQHTAGARVTVTVDYRTDAVEVTVADTGPPKEPADATRHGRGIVGMRERVALYGGQFQAGPQPSGGFTVRALLPLGGPDA